MHFLYQSILSGAFFISAYFQEHFLSEYTFRSIFFIRSISGAFQEHFLSVHTFRSIFFIRVNFPEHFLYHSILIGAFTSSEYTFRSIFYFRVYFQEHLSSEYTFRSSFFIRLYIQKQFLCQSILSKEQFLYQSKHSEVFYLA